MSALTPPRLPAEWEPQRAVMLTWPHSEGDWADLIDAVEPVFFAIAQVVARRQDLLVNCACETQAAHIRARLVEAGVDQGRLFLPVNASNDTWARDHGPITVLHGAKPTLLDFRFNGWGNKYPADLDDALNGKLAGAGVWGDCAFESLPLVLEGGSLDSDGRGTLLTTKSCLLNPSRNPGLDAAALEAQLHALLGTERILWLEHGCLEGDDTDGHIDMLARFSESGILLYQGCDEPGYGCYASLEAMADELRALRDAGGRPYTLRALPWPKPKFNTAGERLPASYANFLVINDAVLMPAYRDPADALAADMLREAFPGREVETIDCLPVIQQFGSLHCLTMQLPAAVPLCRP